MKLGYKCRECFDTWDLSDLSDLREISTIREDDKVVITVTTDKGFKKDYKIHKSRSFKVLMSKIKYGILLRYKKTDKVKYEQIKNDKKTIRLSLYDGTNELNEKMKVEGHSEVKQRSVYLGA
uniref:Uncharacterized protein n=1 Tax=Euplotes harpa TaxID=151035 RepID=A0A7S3JLZ0_9SPIT|mmetsp:Transcript_8872/g.10039  ORF Transcript_8872/g.10039 Transcript_8872/m.10039 type:complete len:122 (+) Transcript_8872:159-524(+)|eukprot:CAMPEP_0168332442 /NCGR_PEP_ID=MMETSP0213-20121227/8959_1 /TAXON_ID=151035 /ORGANISM="Euplotes harpa, Strain FSP1.4" /LENGTH=121 /DNA_ID=CAMNT_0008336465 /DNA_START=159 /DNA_END=524 /DNA_ORIENTATION=+